MYSDTGTIEIGKNNEDCVVVLNRITEEKQVDIGKKNYNNINTNTKEIVRIFKFLRISSTSCF